MKIKHLVKVLFDRRSPKITQEWLDRRYEFFAKHTLRSLQAQTFKDFTLWINCDPGMEWPSMIERLKPILQDACMSSIITFGDYSLPVGLHRCDYVYVTRLDSDDLLASNAMEAVASLYPKEPFCVPEAGIFKRGYMHDVRTGELSVYDNPSSPFHTLMIPWRHWSDPVLYRSLWDKVGDHSRVNDALPSQALPHWRFTVLVHGDNFITDMGYSTDRKESVPVNWSVDSWMAQPVVVDVDDFCDQHGAATLADLDVLKAHYPAFKATLFTIPTKTSPLLLAEARLRPWLELAVHGITHEPNEELRAVSPLALKTYLQQHNLPDYVKGFRPPGWFITPSHVEALNETGHWVALHARDRKSLGPLCRHGYYTCEDRLPYSHHHSHDVCDNWLHKDLPRLLKQWPRHQPFAFVSEEVLIPQSRHYSSK